MPQQAQTLILIALMVAAFYFLIMRPQRKRQQALQQTMRSLGPGARVMLTSGIYGTVVATGSRRAVIEVAPGVEITILKQAITRVVADADEDDELDYGPDGDELDDEFAEPERVLEDSEPQRGDAEKPASDRPSTT